MATTATLSHAFLGQDSLIKKVGLALGGAILIAIAAQLSIGYPVPISLQTLAILMVGFTLGGRLALASMLTYVGMGAMGLPVFSNGMAAAALIGPTAGFIYSFIFMGWAAGVASDRGIKTFLPVTIVGLILSAAIYVLGVAWPMYIAGTFGIEAKWVGSSADTIWTYWVSPFILGDIIKTVIAAMLVTGGWAALKSRKG
ncbi:biotin transporter BioY [Algirhabdus cladophorae]|uniref:biotin transporter BioY n=1 Tax=Algirhabdus cladophorae TaxID=3377108 RepID=UPI003B8453D2